MYFRLLSILGLLIVGCTSVPSEETSSTTGQSTQIFEETTSETTISRSTSVDPPLPPSPGENEPSAATENNPSTMLKDNSDDTLSGEELTKEDTQESEKPDEGQPNFEGSVPFDGFVSVSAGLDYSCGIRSSGLVNCWNWWYMSNGELGLDLDTPDGIFESVDAGWEYACGIRLGGSLECWGETPLAGAMPPEGEFRDVSVGIEHACAVRVDGELKCWGRMEPFRGSGDPPEGIFIDIVSGADFHCGMRPGGSVDCWGNSFTFLEAPAGEFEMISAKGENVCGIRLSGSVECWGSWESSNERPYLAPPEGEFVYINVGRSKQSEDEEWNGFACGIQTDHTATCWGEVSVNFPLEEKLKTIFLGPINICAILLDKTLKCWAIADLQASQEGQNTATVPLKGEFAEISVVNEENMRWCGIRPNRDLSCWGGEFYSGRGLSALAVLWKYTSLSNHGSYTCALTQSATASCWDPPLDQRDTPEGQFLDISVADSPCGLRLNGKVECWGYGITSGVNTSKNYPPEGKFTLVEAGWGGDDHLGGNPETGRGISCALKEDNSIECWGESILSYGEGSTRGNEFAGISIGSEHLHCALRTDGVIHCGQFSTWDRIFGLDYPEDERFTHVSMGPRRICGLRATGSIECWTNTGELLGQIPGDFTQLDVGYYYNSDISYACALRQNKQIICWELIEGVFDRLSEGVDHYQGIECLVGAVIEHFCWVSGYAPTNLAQILDDNILLESPKLLK